MLDDAANHDKMVPNVGSPERSLVLAWLDNYTNKSRWNTLLAESHEAGSSYHRGQPMKSTKSAGDPTIQKLGIKELFTQTYNFDTHDLFRKAQRGESVERRPRIE